MNKTLAAARIGTWCLLTCVLAAGCSSTHTENASSSGNASRPRQTATPLAVVPAKPVVTLPPVPYRHSTRVDGIGVSVASMVRIKAKATGIGERSGPAVAVTLRLVNRTKGVVDLDSTSVTATVLQGHEPTSRVEQVSRPGFAGRLRPGATATAAYAFSLPPGAGKRIVLAVSPSPDRPVVQLVGTLA